MFLNFLKPNIAFGSSGSSGGGGGGGGGGSSSSSSSSSKPAKKTTTTTTKKKKTSSKIGTDAGDGMVWAKSSNSNALVRVSKNKSSGGRNLDADMAAGSGYAPTKNAGTSKAKQVTYTNDTDGPKRKEVALTKKTPIQSKTSVTAKDLKAGKVTTYKAKSGTGSVTVARGTKFEDVPEVNVGGKTNKETYDPVGSTPNKTNPVTTKTTSTEPVTAPETIRPQDGVGGGGRDGGKSGKLKASKVNEDNLRVQRNSEGVDRYKRAQASSIKSAGERRRKNAMKIKRQA